MNQNERVLRHLRVCPITTLQAFKWMGCTRLSGRIYDLRSMGHRIDDRFITVRNRRGEICRVKEYRLIREKT
jgi:Helix-turn-helix domain